MIFPPILNSYYTMKGYIFVIFFVKDQKINNADTFLQPSLIIFAKGANNSDHYCIFRHRHNCIILAADQNIFKLHLYNEYEFKRHTLSFNLRVFSQLEEVSPNK